MSVGRHARIGGIVLMESRRIAFYGKGGVGKTTIASNMCACLAEESRVLQIGCDPKHDSTRSLTGLAEPVTAVDMLRRKPEEDITAEDLITTGYRDVDCLEVGGPEPGVGCAGLGIIKTLEIVKSLSIIEGNYDYVIFDVLGDVVCGGFAAPMRLDFARDVYVVTSGEMMSLYAANNISRGVKRYADLGPVRLCGIIGNQRTPQRDMSPVQRFAESIGAPVVYTLPYYEDLGVCEKKHQTVCECMPDSALCHEFNELSRAIASNSQSCIPSPMTDGEFDKFCVNNL